MQRKRAPHVMRGRDWVAAGLAVRAGDRIDRTTLIFKTAKMG
jgi:hypothetical protein